MTSLLPLIPKPVPGGADEHVFERRLAQCDRTNLARELARQRVDQFGPLGRFDAELRLEELWREME